MKPISVHFFVKSTLEIIITHKHSSIVTKAVRLTALHKINQNEFYPRFGSPDMSIRIILEQCKHNKHIEIEQRAVDIGSIYENCDTDLRLKVLKPSSAMKLVDLNGMYTMESKDETEESLSDSSSSE